MYRLLSVAALAWLRKHDRGFAALRRAGRTAIVMPALLAISAKVIEDPVVATFAAFGSFAMLLLVDFTGAMRDRLHDQAALALACGALITIATLVSRTTWLAAVTMALVGFAILFVGAASSVLAAATQTLLLSFILPVSLAGAASSIPERLAGWGMASGCSLLAIALLWPAPTHDPVRRQAIAACRALAARLRAEIAMHSAGGGEAARKTFEEAAAASDEAVRALQETFFATPFRPSGLGMAARAVVRLVDELRWLDTIAVRAVSAHRTANAHPGVLVVKAAAARVLEAAADLLEDPTASPAALHEALEGLRSALADLERVTTMRLLGTPQTTAAHGREVVSALSPSFRAQEMSFVVGQIAASADAAAAAERRTWLQRVLGHRPPGLPGTLAAAQERTEARLERHSVWLQNSLRGASGLGLAVLVAQVSSVQHSFWVVLGALSVLRSNALSTGQNALRAIGGTAVGFAVGGTLVWLIGTNETLLWVLLPVAILLAGLAPAVVSFGAGQAAFTLTVLILFNILHPAGWSLGLVRIEDVALGCGVSLIVGVLLWPRGAGAALGRALAEAYQDSAAYLASAVAFGIGRCDASRSAPPGPTEAIRAAASSRRLDDAFRGYLGERGAKPVPLAEVTSLVTGVAGLRLAGDAVLDLWRGDASQGGDPAAVRAELAASADRITGWYEDFAASLIGRSAVPEPQESDQVADGRLIDAVGRDLRDDQGQAAATAVRVLWTGDHLDAARRLQPTLVAPAQAAVDERALV